jgi:hypothetical protein
MRALKQLLLPVLLVVGAQQSVIAQGLDYLETRDLRLLYFNPDESYVAPYAAVSFESSMRSQRAIFGFEPYEKVSTLLTDFVDYGGAGALAVPRNMLMVDVAPRPPTFETIAAAERMRAWMQHELVHIATMDQPNSNDKRARRFFGGKVWAEAEHPETILYSYLTAPRHYAPRWYHEGIAVFVETWMAGGLGRAQGGYDEMVFRSMIRDNTHIYDPLGLAAEGTKIDFQVSANAYLYGTRFMTYVALTYGPDKLISWVTRQEGSNRSYNTEFERVFGLKLDTAWQNWIDFEREFQSRNLDSVRQYPTTPHQDITSRALGSISRGFVDEESGTLYAAFRYPGVVAHVGALSLQDGSIERLQDVKSPMLYRVTSLAHDPDSKTLFYTADNYAFRDLMAIDVESGKTQMLLEDARIGELVFNRHDRSIWGVRHLHGLASLVRIPYPYTEWNVIQTFPYGVSLYDMDISPDGKLLSSSFGDVTGQQDLRIFELESLLSGDMTPLKSFDLGQAIPEGFVFSPDNQYLFGSSYYTGVSNIWRYELATEELEIVSNTESGFFRPIPRNDGSLIIFHYTGDGFVPATIQPIPLEDVGAITFLGTETIRKHPVLAEWEAGSPSDIDLADLKTSEGTYSPVKSLGLESWFPKIEGYKDSVSLGVNFKFSDPMLLDKLSIGVGHSLDSDLPSDERLNLTLDYQHAVISASPLSGTWSMGAHLNYADFYDLFGPTKQSRKGQRYYIGYNKTLIYDEPRILSFSTELNHHKDMDALPRYQNIPATFDELTTLYADLDYEHLRRSLGAVDDEKGFRWSLAATANHVDGDTIPKIGAEFDFGFALPWKHSSIWFRNAAGAAFGEPDDEFANFFFGGFGNNYVDSGEIKRYREFYAFPGFELNAIPGRNFYRNMIEWNLPPIRFDRAGHANFYLAYARPAIFASSISTNFDDDLLEYNAHNIGIQVDFHIEFFSRLPITLSVGYAKGYGEDDLTDDEFMISLKIM